MDQKAYHIRGLCRAIGVGRTSAFKLIAAHEFETFKQGSRTYVTAVSVDAYIKRRLAASRQTDATGADHEGTSAKVEQ